MNSPDMLKNRLYQAKRQIEDLQADTKEHIASLQQPSQSGRDMTEFDQSMSLALTNIVYKLRGELLDQLKPIHEALSALLDDASQDADG